MASNVYEDFLSMSMLSQLDDDEGTSGIPSVLGGIDINERDSNGLTSLYMAVMSGKKENVEILLKNGANPNVANNMGMIPLHIVGNFPDTDIASLLIKHGAMVNHSTRLRTTPLQSAAKNGNTELIRLLMRNGADPTAQDNTGTNALELAKNEETTKVLIEEIKFSQGKRCEFCGMSEFVPNASLKRCSSCKLVFYCGRNCQRKDWKEAHQFQCKATTGGYPLVDSEKETILINSYQTGQIRAITTDEVRVSIETHGPEKFMVKVQITHSDGQPPLLVYNEDRSIVFDVYKEDPGYAALVQKIFSAGCPVKYKAFFWARKNDEGVIKIFYGKTAPFQSW